MYKPKFLKKEGKNYYHWSSLISMLKLYQSKGNLTNSFNLFGLFPNRKILRVSFILNWKSKISTNKKFLEYDCDEPKYLERNFEFPTEEENFYFRDKLSDENK